MKSKDVIVLKKILDYCSQHGIPYSMICRNCE